MASDKTMSNDKSITKDELLAERSDLLRRIKMLEREIKSMEVDTRKVAVDVCQYDTPGKNGINVQEPTNVKLLHKLLKLNQLVCKIYFQRVEQHTITHNRHVLRGIASCGEVNFDFQVEIKKPQAVQSVLLKLEDEKLEGELKAFVRQCARRKAFQVLMSGVAEYGALLGRMKGVVQWLRARHAAHLTVLRDDLCGCVVRSAQLCCGGEDEDEDGEPTVTVHWKIKWTESDMMMIDRFVIEIGDPDFPQSVREKWTDFCSVKLYSEEVLKAFWEEVVAALQG